MCLPACLRSGKAPIPPQVYFCPLRRKRELPPAFLGTLCTLDAGVPNYPSDLRWKFGGIWTLNHSSPPSLLRMTVQCQPVLQSCTLRGTRTPSGPQGPPTLHAQHFRRGRSQARHLMCPEAAQGTGHSNGLGRARWQLGPGLVRCVHTHACTQEHMHTCVYTHTHTHPRDGGGRPGGWGCSHRRPHSSPIAPMGEG